MRERKRRLNDRCQRAVSDGIVPRQEVSRQQSLVSSGEARTMVFCGDAEQVSAGFSLALGVMESSADLLTASPEPAQLKN
jgi:hypothetical protein